MPFRNMLLFLFSMQTKIGNVSELPFQLKSSWDEATEHGKEVCIEKAMEGLYVK